MIKRLIPLMVCLLLGGVAFAQGGVEFRDLTFDEALVKAKAEKKLVFVDCYTAWCAPCKAMAKDVFPQKAAGDFFNPRFISLKIDMEKDEGKELAQKWNIRVFPTYLILDPQGESWARERILRFLLSVPTARCSMPLSVVVNWMC